MIIRRAFYYVHVVAAFVLPAWLLTGWGLFAGGGLELLLVLVGTAVLFIAMIAVAGVTFARKSVRVDHALSWADTALLTAWYAAIIAAGFFTSWGGFVIAAVVLVGIAAFWSAVAQLVSDTGRRVRTVFESFSVPLPPTAPPAAFPPSSTWGGSPARSPYADGEYIVIETSRDR